MKLFPVNLLADVSSVAYDQTKTMIRGNVFQKTISGKQYLGPALNRWIDVFTDTGLTPAAVFATANGRIFVATTETATIVSVAMYTFDFATGTPAYIGKITMHAGDTASTTHTIRSFKVIDTGTTGWKIFWVSTGSVLINGGVYMANKVDLADFTNLGTDFPFATGNDQKATYFLQDPANIGVGQLNTTSAGAALDPNTNRLYVHNGIAATHQYHIYSTNTTPTYQNDSVSVTVGTPGVVTHAAHGFVTATSIVFTAGTLPTGLVVGTNYFVRNPTANTYELAVSASTAGTGPSINTTGSPSSGAFAGRSFGTTGSNFVHKTGNLPALTGTLITLDSEDFAVPGHTTNAGQDCVFFGTTTNMYFGQLSELTPPVTASAIAVSTPGVVTHNSHGYAVNTPITFISGPLPTGLTVGVTYFVRNPSTNTYEVSATSGGVSINTTGSPASNILVGISTWSSLVTANNNGDNSTIAQSARSYAYSNTLDRVLISTVGSLRFILKQVVNSISDRIFGRTNISAYEGTTPSVVYIGANTELSIVSTIIRNGWLFMASNASGQRGIVATDLRSDSLFGFSYIISPVVTATNGILKALSRIRALDNQTDGMIMEYRTSGFGSESGGWTSLVPFDEYNIPVPTQIQLKVQFDTLTKEAKGLHAQLNELLLGINGLNELSDNWEFSDDNSGNGSPSRAAFRLKQTYNTTVPTLHFRARDLTDVLLVAHNTVTNAANFEYSTDSGISWAPLGTIPNTVGTLVRYTFTSPPGVDVRPSIQES